MAATAKNGQPTEDQEQSWLVAWFRKEYPNYRMFAIPNGGYRSKSEGALLKATGVVAGVPDLMIAAPAGCHHGLFIEMKVQSGGRVSPDQKEWNAYLLEKGYRAEVCNGFEEAKKVIIDYLSNSTQSHTI